ncbi:MAG: DUF2306 domain-containing protein, partial [Gammaproteobacteria bacterium]|nr:DUF2306 domain-containing protein [Gammaproteobacteria bacterium]
MTTRIYGSPVGVWLLIVLAIPIGLYALAFQFFGAGAPDFQLRFAQVPWAAGTHLIGGGIALLIGGVQFIGRIRSEAPAVHRWLGRLYLTLVLIGGVGGGLLALQAAGGLVARVGFFLLAVIW